MKIKSWSFLSGCTQISWNWLSNAKFGTGPKTDEADRNGPDIMLQEARAEGRLAISQVGERDRRDGLGLDLY